MAKTIKTRIQNKHDIAANWEKAVNFIPLAGEIVIYDDHYFDEDGNKVVVADTVRYKVGDGVVQEDESVIGTKLNDLPFVQDFYDEQINSVNEKIDALPQADWDQTDTAAKDFIKNKPALAPVATSGLFEDLIIDWQSIEMVFDGGDAGSDAPVALVGTTFLQ